MKTILLFLLSVGALFGQVTFTMAITGDVPVAVTNSAESLIAATNMMLGTVGPGTSPTTLTASATSTQTTFAVANILGVQTCMGILTGSELSLITGITAGSGTTGTLTVTRHTIGTTAAAYSSGQAASFTAWGEGTCYLAFVYQAGVRATMIATPGPSVAAQQTSIANATAAILALQAAGVTHVP